MKKIDTRYLVRTALLLAIAVLFQEMSVLWAGTGFPASQIITGSLINLTLIVAAGLLGWKGAAVIAAVSPVLAALRGQIPIELSPFVAAGNLALIFAYCLLTKESAGTIRLYAGMAVAAVCKAAALYLLVIHVFLPFVFPYMNKPKAMAASLSEMFRWWQLVTALLGGIVAVPVIKGVRRAIQKGNRAG